MAWGNNITHILQIDLAQSACTPGDLMSGVLVHFPATIGETVYTICFAPDRAVLAVTGTSGHCINIFRLFTHPCGSTMAAVHHLYSCMRGSTPAKLVDLVFSADTRWLAATSNHGTTHVFGITPYGGMWQYWIWGVM